jgi:hypothetical protein
MQYYQCDGCGRQRTVNKGFPKDWTKRETWRDGSVTDHYCASCSSFSGIRPRIRGEKA